MEEEAEVGTVTVKLPAFWIDKPEAWFAQAEANFRARRIMKQMSKFQPGHGFARLWYRQRGVGLVKEPARGRPVTTSWRARLVQSFQLSTVDKVRAGARITAFGRRKPNQDGRLARGVGRWGQAQRKSYKPSSCWNCQKAYGRRCGQNRWARGQQWRPGQAASGTQRRPRVRPAYAPQRALGLTCPRRTPSRPKNGQKVRGAKVRIEIHSNSSSSSPPTSTNVRTARACSMNFTGRLRTSAVSRAVWREMAGKAAGRQ